MEFNENENENESDNDNNDEHNDIRKPDKVIKEKLIEEYESEDEDNNYEEDDNYNNNDEFCEDDGYEEINRSSGKSRKKMYEDLKNNDIGYFSISKNIKGINYKIEMESFRLNNHIKKL